VVVGLYSRAHPSTLAPIARSDVGFHPDDRLDPALLGFFLEIPGCVQVAVVRDCEGGLFELLRAPNQIVYSVSSVQ
jgi:hypothetical protein